MLSRREPGRCRLLTRHADLRDGCRVALHRNGVVSGKRRGTNPKTGVSTRRQFLWSKSSRERLTNILHVLLVPRVPSRCACSRAYFLSVVLCGNLFKVRTQSLSRDNPQRATVSLHDFLHDFRLHGFPLMVARRTYQWILVTLLSSSLPSVKIGTIQRRLAWVLRKVDTHKSRS